MTRVVALPKCNIFLIKRSETFVLRCQAEGNPTNFTFSWKKSNVTFSETDAIHNDSSLVELELQKKEFGTYYCHVKNSVGSGMPCKIVVNFHELGIPLVKSISPLFVAIIISCLFISILCTVVILFICTRRTKKKKKKKMPHPPSPAPAPVPHPPPDVTQDIHHKCIQYQKDRNIPLNRVLDYPMSDVTLARDDNKHFIRGQRGHNHLL